MACEKILGEIITEDTITIQLVFASVDDDGDETPEDITGWTIEATLKNDLADDDVDALFQVTEVVPAGAEATAGRHLFTIPTTATTGLTAGTRWFGMKRIISGSPDDVLTIAREQVDVVLEV